MNKKLFFCFFFLMICGQIFAQQTASDTTNATQSDSTGNKMANDDDVDDNTVDNDSTADWAYSFGLDGDFKTGNYQRSYLALRSTFSNENKTRYLGFHTSPRYSWGIQNDLLLEREAFLDLNVTFGFHQHDVYGLVFGVFENSNLRKINTRFYAGAGLGWRAYGGKAKPSDNFKLTFSVALLHENTDFIIKDDISVWRLSNRVKIVWHIIPNKLTFQNYTFLQPAFEAKYFRWNAITSLQMALSKRVSFSLNYENSYESYVTPNLQNTDTHLTFGLLLKSL